MQAMDTGCTTVGWSVPTALVTAVSFWRDTGAEIRTEIVVIADVMRTEPLHDGLDVLNEDKATERARDVDNFPYFLIAEAMWTERVATDPEHPCIQAKAFSRPQKLILLFRIKMPSECRHSATVI